MLNKPINVSPYNKFIDASESFTYDFTLNNVITNGYVAAYSNDTNQIVECKNFENALSNSKKFSIDATISKYVNGNDYYWRSFYWIQPSSSKSNTSKAIKLFEKSILSWDKSGQSITIQATPTLTITVPSTYTYSTSPLYGVDYGGGVNPHRTVVYIRNSTNNLSSIKANIESGAEYWVCIPNLIPPTKIIGLVLNSMVESQSNMWEITPVPYQSYTSTEFDYRGIADNLAGKSLCLFKIDSVVGTDGLCVPGDFINFSSVTTTPSLYSTKLMMKIDSISFGTNTNGVTITTKFTERFPVDIVGSSPYGTVIGYRNVDYNSSPPYYYSARKPLNISMVIENNSTPYITVSATTPYLNNAVYTPIEVKYYKYSIYKDSDGSWELLDASDFLDELPCEFISGGSNMNYVFSSHIFKGLKWNELYKITIEGQTIDGNDFYEETTLNTTYSEPTNETKNFAVFNKELGCVEIDNSMFIVADSDTTMYICRYNTTIDNFDHVSTIKYDINTTPVTGGIKKFSKLYDFNFIPRMKYVYYAFIIKDNEVISSYKSQVVTEIFEGLYITDLIENYDGTYTPQISDTWYLRYNYEPSEIKRNYKVNYPIGINSKYPKMSRGNTIHKTSSISGIVGNYCSSEEFLHQSPALSIKWDKFCNNDNQKLIRSYVYDDCVIAGIDNMGTSMFGETCLQTNIGYTQTNDINRKIISVEV